MLGMDELSQLKTFSMSLKSKFSMIFLAPVIILSNQILSDFFAIQTLHGHGCFLNQKKTGNNSSFQIIISTKMLHCMNGLSSWLFTCTNLPSSGHKTSAKWVGFATIYPQSNPPWYALLANTANCSSHWDFENLGFLRLYFKNKQGVGLNVFVLGICRVPPFCLLSYFLSETQKATTCTKDFYNALFST